MAGDMGRRYLIVLLVIGITLPTINCEEITEQWKVPFKGPVKAIIPVDFNGDGVDDGAVIGTDVGEVDCVDSSGFRWKKTGLGGVYGAATADLSGDGNDDAIIIAANDVYAYDLDGNEIWKYPIAGSARSVAVADTDSDGKDEIFVGAWKGAYFIDDDGNTIFSYDSSVVNSYVDVAFILNNRIYYADGAAIRAIDFGGEMRWGTALDASVAAGSPADLDGDGVLDDVVFGDLDGKLYGFDERGTQIWKNEKNFEYGYKMVISPIDVDSDGKPSEILWASGAIYVLGPSGNYIWISSIADPKGVSPIDFDRDGISDDVIVGTFRYNYALDSEGTRLSIGGSDKSSPPGSNGLVAVDLDSDGFLDDFISASEDTFDISAYSTSFRDYTTSPQTSAPLPTTTSPPEATPLPETIAPTTTPPPEATSPPAEVDSEVEKLRLENERLQMELEKERLKAEQSKAVCGPTLMGLLVLIPLLSRRARG